MIPKDYRRFGSWALTEDWGEDRGPCILTENNAFVENLASHLDSTVFDKPICEVMLNQAYFHGVGNYLRAEILHRAGVHPYGRAREVIEDAIKVCR